MWRHVGLFEVTGKDISCSECRAVCACVVVVSCVVGLLSPGCAEVSILCCSYVWYRRLCCGDMCSVIGGLSCYGVSEMELVVKQLK